MSQRGSLLQRADDKSPVISWAHIRKIIFFTLMFTLGTSLTLIAQEILKPKTVLLNVGGFERTVTTHKETVQTLLHQEFISLGPHDRCEPPLNSPVTDGMTVTVTRVACETVTKRVEVPPPTITRWIAGFSSEPQVVSEGTPGINEETHVVWKKNGEVSVSWVQRTRVIKKPSPRIVVQGNLASRSGLRVRRILTMEATAYDPGPLSCGKNSTGRTATGIRATKGVVAVDPRVIPLGTRVFVDGYGLAIAADTGGAIKGNRIDVCFDTRREALNWGRRTVTVMILE